MSTSPNVRWELGEVTRDLREKLNGHPALVVWLTGFSASGKSTLAKAAEQVLFEAGTTVARLDGDNVRHGLCGDLGFSADDRNENIRRVAEVAAILHDLGHVVLCAFISPFASERKLARSLVPEGRFLEVYVRCDIDLCKKRDPKGLYAKAQRGEIRSFTGVDSAYEEPANPELVIDTGRLDQEASVTLLVDTINDYLAGRKGAAKGGRTPSQTAGRWQ